MPKLLVAVALVFASGCQDNGRVTITVEQQAKLDRAVRLAQKYTLDPAEQAEFQRLKNEILAEHPQHPEREYISATLANAMREGRVRTVQQQRAENEQQKAQVRELIKHESSPEKRAELLQLLEKLEALDREFEAIGNVR